jgi:hypothetical protein
MQSHTVLVSTLIYCLPPAAEDVLPSKWECDTQVDVS